MCVSPKIKTELQIEKNERSGGVGEGRATTYIARLHVTHHEGSSAKFSWNPSIAEVISVDGYGREVRGLPFECNVCAE